MNYYLINKMPRENREFCFFHHPPQGTQMFSYCASEGEPILHKWPSPARMDMEKDERGIQLPDLIGNTKSFLIVKNAVKDVFESVLNNPIEYLPIEIFDHQGKLASSEYFIVNPIGTIDCLNRVKSVIEYDDEDPNVVIGVDKMILDKQKIDALPHLFRVKEDPRSYVISQHLALELKARKFNNIYTWELTQV